MLRQMLLPAPGTGKKDSLVRIIHDPPAKSAPTQSWQNGVFARSDLGDSPRKCLGTETSPAPESIPAVESIATRSSRKAFIHDVIVRSWRKDAGPSASSVAPVFIMLPRVTFVVFYLVEFQSAMLPRRGIVPLLPVDFDSAFQNTALTLSLLISRVPTIFPRTGALGSEAKISVPAGSNLGRYTRH